MTDNTPRTDALLAKFQPSIRDMTPLGQLGQLYQALRDTERELADAQLRIKSLEDGSTEISMHLIRAGIASFGWNREGVDKLARERDEALACREHWKREAEAGYAYAGYLQALLREWLEHTVSEITEADGQWADGWIDRVRAALAKNPNPSGQPGAEALGAHAPIRSEASGPVGLGPTALTHGGQFVQCPRCSRPVPLTADALLTRRKSDGRHQAS